MKRTITFPDELDDDIVALAKATDRSFSNYVIHATRSETKKQKSKYSLPSLKSKSDAGNAESGDN